jgi:hypothetical protein
MFSQEEDEEAPRDRDGPSGSGHAVDEESDCRETEPC